MVSTGHGYEGLKGIKDGGETVEACVWVSDPRTPAERTRQIGAAKSVMRTRPYLETMQGICAKHAGSPTRSDRIQETAGEGRFTI